MARVQVGIIAKRDVAGNFLPAKPIYRKTKDIEASEEMVLTKCEEKCCDNFGKFMFEKYFKTYIDECKKTGIDPFPAR